MSAYLNREEQEKAHQEINAMYLRNFIHYHKNRIFRTRLAALHKFPVGVEPDEDETSAEKSKKILKDFGVE
ncbi:hypothetical protein KDA08_03625 [Candidatus Saccharibacteria bacterium]|nr:hypothetical protein [Candidatus Saccharibacteria bacterium]